MLIFGTTQLASFNRTLISVSLFVFFLLLVTTMKKSLKKNLIDCIDRYTQRYTFLTFTVILLSATLQKLSSDQIKFCKCGLRTGGRLQYLEDGSGMDIMLCWVVLMCRSVKHKDSQRSNIFYKLYVCSVESILVCIRVFNVNTIK